MHRYSDSQTLGCFVVLCCAFSRFLLLVCVALFLVSYCADSCCAPSIQCVAGWSALRSRSAQLGRTGRPFLREYFGPVHFEPQYPEHSEPQPQYHSHDSTLGTSNHSPTAPEYIRHFQQLSPTPQLVCYVKEGSTPVHLSSHH